MTFRTPYYSCHFPRLLFVVWLGLAVAWGDEPPVPVKAPEEKNAAQLIAEGQQYFRAGRYDLAEKRARQTLVLDAGNAEADQLLKQIGHERAKYDLRYFPQIGKMPVPATERGAINREYAVVFPEKGRFVIEDAQGKVVFSSQDVAELRDLAEFQSNSVLWSRDSQAVALAGGNGHDLHTYVLVKKEDGFVLVPLKVAESYDNPHILPYQWLDGRRLLLEISGPYAGKADGYFYTGRASVRVSVSPPGSRVDYEEIN